jgi:AbrB family looped-hinge helix DNA binding protein
MKTTIDSAGRIVIPKVIREQAGLYAGMPIEIRLDDDRVVLTPERPAQQLVRQGRYVAILRQDAEPALTDELVEAVRDEIWLERVRQAGTGGGS